MTGAPGCYGRKPNSEGWFWLVRTDTIGRCGAGRRRARNQQATNNNHGRNDGRMEREVDVVRDAGSAQRWTIALGSAVCMAVGMSAIFMARSRVLGAGVAESRLGQSDLPANHGDFGHRRALCNRSAGVDRSHRVKLPVSVGWWCLAADWSGFLSSSVPDDVLGRWLAIGFGAALSGRWHL